jgi:hypothetical protein
MPSLSKWGLASGHLGKVDSALCGNAGSAAGPTGAGYVEGRDDAARSERYPVGDRLKGDAGR